MKEGIDVNVCLNKCREPEKPVAFFIGVFFYRHSETQVALRDRCRGVLGDATSKRQLAVVESLVEAPAELLYRFANPFDVDLSRDGEGGGERERRAREREREIRRGGKKHVDKTGKT
jgi:hypothetical protein